MTKCPPSLTAKEEATARASVGRYTESPVFFSAIRYGQPVPFGGHDLPLQQKLLLVTGIANVEPLLAYLSGKYQIIRHIDHADHYRYTAKDLEQLHTLVTDDVSVLTTEKDMVKLDALRVAVSFTLPLFYLPMEVAFLKDGG